MNYIHSLEGIKRDAHWLGKQAQTDLCELLSYLVSDKFSVDPTVQVTDVINRLKPLRSTLIDLVAITHPNNDRSRVHHFESNL